MAPAVPVTWVSSDTAVIVVNDSGVVTGVGAGEADITVMHAGVLATVHASVSPVPGRLLSLDGNAQSAEAGTRLATPVRVLLESRRGRPMAGVSVHFVAERGGTADPAYATTNAEGIAVQHLDARGRCRAGNGCRRRAPSSTARRCCWPRRSRQRPTPG